VKPQEPKLAQSQSFFVIHHNTKHNYNPPPEPAAPAPAAQEPGRGQ